MMASMARPSWGERRPATDVELKAMAHPLRLRILRLCLDQALTNKELADRLDRDPATVLHHVRTLVGTGFLVAEQVRAGARGALEKPYRATGKSWRLSIDDSPVDDQQRDHLAMVDALREEVADAGPERVKILSRLGLLLSDQAAAELAGRLDDLIDELAGRDPDPAGRPYGLFLGLHEH